MKNPSNFFNRPAKNTATVTDVMLRAALGTRKYADEAAPVHAPEPEITLDYPRIGSQPEYAAELEKLNRFTAQRDQAIKTHEALNAEIERSGDIERADDGDAVAKVERLLAGGAARDLASERAAATKLIHALGEAIYAQAIVVRKIDQALSRAAGRRFSEEHKERVRRVMAAVVELHEANRAECHLRTDLGRLGYNGDTLPPMILNSVQDPYAVSENITWYWYEEAKKYVQTDAQVAAGVRRARLSAAIA